MVSIKRSFGVVLHICACITYLYMIWGTNVIYDTWVVAESPSFQAFIPLAGFTLVVGLISIIFLRNEQFDFSSGLFVIFWMIVIQSITVCLWTDKGIVDVVIFLVVVAILNAISAIPGFILGGVEMNLKKRN